MTEKKFVQVSTTCTENGYVIVVGLDKDGQAWMVDENAHIFDWIRVEEYMRRAKQENET